MYTVLTHVFSAAALGQSFHYYPHFIGVEMDGQRGRGKYQ